MKRIILFSIFSIIAGFSLGSFVFHDNRPAPATEWHTHELPMPDQIVFGAWLENGRWEYHEVIRIDMPSNEIDSPIKDFYFLASGEGTKMPFNRPKAWTDTMPTKAPW